jgi:competence protein ComEC
MKHKLFYFNGILSLFLGVFLNLKILVIILILLGLSSLFIKKYQKLFLISFFAVLISFIVLNFTTDKNKTNLNKYYNQKLSFSGKIIEFPDNRPEFVFYKILVNKINNQKTNFNLLLKAPKYPPYQLGDKIQTKSKIIDPEIISKSYKNYLLQKNIQAYSKTYFLEKTGETNISKFKQIVQVSRNYFKKIIKQNYPAKYANFLLGVLVGDQSGITENQEEAFKKTGLTHILVVSGSNLSLFLLGITLLLFYLPKKLRFFISLLAIIFFCFFTGKDSSILRAGVMSFVLLISINLGRKLDSVLVVLMTVYFLSLTNPLILFYDIGFQLSLGALLGVLWGVKLIPEKFFQKIPEKFSLREILLLSLGAQIGVFPILIYQFQSFSLISPLANILVLPFIPIILSLSLLSLIPFFYLKIIFVQFNIFLMDFIFKLTEILASIPYAYLENLKNVSFIISFYFLFLLLVFKNYVNQKKSDT